MFLLMGNINHDNICLIECWHSGKMLRYIHVTAKPLMHSYATTMFAAGD